MYCLFYNWDTLNGIGNSVSYVLTFKLENLEQFWATFSHQNNGTCSKKYSLPCVLLCKYFTRYLCASQEKNTIFHMNVSHVYYYDNYL